MPKKPIDRRIARTRAMLQEAHISLILEKGYEATTVEDICDAADVGRSTMGRVRAGVGGGRRGGCPGVSGQTRRWATSGFKCSRETIAICRS